MQLDTLFGLPLLPLANGSFTLVDKEGTGERFYIARDSKNISFLSCHVLKKFLVKGLPVE